MSALVVIVIIDHVAVVHLEEPGACEVVGVAVGRVGVRAQALGVLGLFRAALDRLTEPPHAAVHALAQVAPPNVERHARHTVARTIWKVDACLG